MADVDDIVMREFAQSYAKVIDDAVFGTSREVLAQRKDIAGLPERPFLGDDNWGSVAFPEGRANEQT